jgi:gliding motility-associated-like protein
MKGIITSLCVLVFFGSTIYSQENGRVVTVKEFEQLKKEGKITNERIETVVTKGQQARIRISPNNPTVQSNQCQCMIPLDATFSVVPFSGYSAPSYRNDDGSTNLITLPFNFCYYGTTETGIYINNNGNVSFGSPVSTFSANAFPNATDDMIAPFWSDVDTRNVGSGLVYYKLTSTYLIVKWDSVGYYSQHIDKLNTYQLVMTNGSDPILPSGQNISFCYGQMNWTTGDASSGVNGFGGDPATVGVNRGNNIDYIQMGQFDHAGTVYNGPFGPPSGVNWLNNQSFYFNVCSNSNIPPIAAGVTACDTIRVCVGDSFKITVNWLSPEVAQTTTANATATGLSNFTITSNVPGNTAVISTLAIPTTADVGYHTITYTAVDNGTPPQTSTIVITLRVDTLPHAEAGPNQVLCNGTVQLNASGGATYSWSPSTGLSNPNIANPTANPSSTTNYIVTVSNGICSAKDTMTVTTANSVTASPPVSICLGGSTVITATTGVGSTVVWNPAATLSSATILNPTATPTTTTTYTVTSTDINGCIRKDSVKVTVNPLPVTSAGPNSATCPGSPVNLAATGPAGATYSWTPSATVTAPTSQNTTASPNTTTIYTVTCTDANGCVNTDTVKITVNIPFSEAGPNDSICNGGSTSLHGSGAGTYSWSPAAGLSSTTIASPVASPTVTTNYILTVTIGSCIVTDTVTIKVNPLPVANAGPPVSVCAGIPVTLSGSGGGTYSWTPSTGLNSTTIANPTVTTNGSVTYTLTVRSAAGCTSTNVSSTTVSIYPAASAAFTSSPLNNQYLNVPVLFTDQSTVNPAPGIINSWSWNFGDLGTSSNQNPSHTYLEPGTYRVCLTVNTNNNCSDSTCMDYTVIPHPVLAPNIITPNADGVNDYLAFKYLEFYPNNRLVVYDRWGVKIYEKAEYTNDWDGGSNVDGTYYYILTCPQFKQDMVGFFQIIKGH